MEDNNSFTNTLNELQQGKNPVDKQSNNSNGLTVQQHDINGLKTIDFGLKTIQESVE